MADSGRSGEFPSRLHYELKIETVPCPTCKASAGLPCRTTAGRNPGAVLKGYHKTREDAALGKNVTPAALLNQYGPRPSGKKKWPFGKKD